MKELGTHVVRRRESAVWTSHSSAGVLETLERLLLAGVSGCGGGARQTTSFGGIDGNSNAQVRSLRERDAGLVQRVISVSRRVSFD